MKSKIYQCRNLFMRNVNQFSICEVENYIQGIHSTLLSRDCNVKQRIIHGGNHSLFLVKKHHPKNHLFPDIYGGYLCFVISIFCIGVVTAVIGDVASHFGCTLGIKDTVTAICFVALGTSVPGMLNFDVFLLRYCC